MNQIPVKRINILESILMLRDFLVTLTRQEDGCYTFEWLIPTGALDFSFDSAWLGVYFTHLQITNHRQEIYNLHSMIVEYSPVHSQTIRVTLNKEQSDLLRRIMANNSFCLI